MWYFGKLCMLCHDDMLKRCFDLHVGDKIYFFENQVTKIHFHQIKLYITTNNK